MLGLNETANNKIIKVGELEFPPRKVYIRTYGCQMNEHDTQRILADLRNLNYHQTELMEDADLILFNTCAIRDLANSKFYSHLGETKRIKEDKNRKVIVGAGGCVAQKEGKELIKKYKHLDFCFGTDVIDQITDMIYRIHAGENRFVVNTWDKKSNYSIETKLVQGTPQAFVNIMKGCDNFCTYCIVPFTRGREKSRRIEEIVKDVKNLVKYQGKQEITLLGQNVNSFGHKNGETMAELITELDKIEGLEILRYTTSHPKDVSDELIKVHGTAKRLSRHLHLPVQSGSSSVLDKMGRGYTREHYLEIVRKLKEVKPDIILSTDIICGFPNETEEEHQETIELLKEVKFDLIYAYAFSPRPGTKAAKMEDSLTDPIRNRRLREVQNLQLEIQANERQNKMIGETFRVLIEGKGEKHGVVRWKGRTNCMRIVHTEGLEKDKDYKWHWVDIKIDSATALSCKGTMVKDYGRYLGKTPSFPTFDV